VRWLGAPLQRLVTSVSLRLSSTGLPAPSMTSKSAGLGENAISRRDAREIAVVALPRISNFDDLDPLSLEPGRAGEIRLQAV